SIHTNYTDGENSVAELCERAQNIGIPLIAFTEHVRKNITYDFSGLLNAIDSAKEQYDLIILSGCEAKVLPDGDLDVDPEILKEVDYPIFAYHSFPKDIDIYVKSLKHVLKNMDVCTWAHPGAFLKRYELNLPEKELETIFALMNKYDILLETNIKYNLPEKKWEEIASEYNVQFVRGSDIHNIERLKA
ncbi:MAG: PHP domain-containing protein, partial [Methanosarcina sp.]|nr:PHP domain-containing protein [Methanosarcina sp.]